MYIPEHNKITFDCTLTGVVSGVASIAASGGEVPLLLLLGVGGAERGS